MKRYNPSEIEPKWQKVWEETRTYKAADATSKPKYYALSFFPYPSGVGLHLGHTRNFTITDVVARYKRQTGHEVLHPMGWDSFGLPGENYAIKTGTPPQLTTQQNTDNFRRQAKRLGFSIDWDREFSSTDPEFYKWTQWFFLLLHKRGLAYRRESSQFWCTECKTVLANEQVVNGCCWRHEDLPVTKKMLPQWFFKITDYADRLAADLEGLDWQASIKTMQRNWIGRSKGAEIDFTIADSQEVIKVFTTRADTVYGATFLVLAPEHPLVASVTTPKQRAAVTAYVRQAVTKTDIDRMDEKREKTGVFTGAYATNPMTGKKIPVWAADYVLMGYGTGAIMAVPAHDERDHAFAKKFDLPIIEVIEPETGTPQEGEERRQSIVAIVHDPQTGKYLSLHWKLHNDNLFVGGGVEEGEELTTAAAREIAEETGYTDIEFVAKTGKIHHHYYSHSKKVARFIEAQGLLFTLKTDAAIAPKLETYEKGMFAPQWLTATQIERKIKDELHITAYKQLVKGECYHGEGIMANSGPYDGMASSMAREKIVEELAAKKAGTERINYKIRDWLISRQRYWGAPIPMVHCPTDGIVPLPEDQLPLLLPELKDFAPSGDGRSPLARVREWVETTCPTCGGKAERETDTMDGFACSSWYFMRFADPRNNQEAFSRELAEKWLPVDRYVGGAEHAVMHLLYARMWTKVMFDAGLIGFNEPFTALSNQGMLLAPDGSKFSKSKGNGIDPEDVINSGYGADALRMAMMFIAPFGQQTPWSPEGLGGVYRFLGRIWALTQEAVTAGVFTNTTSQYETLALAVPMHRTIKKVTADLQDLSLNTAIAALMEYVNELYKQKSVLPFTENAAAWHHALHSLVQMIAPFAPHLAEELWQQMGHTTSVHIDGWPSWDEALLTQDVVTVVVQVNGKVRAQLAIAADAEQAEVQTLALAEPKVQAIVGDATPKKIVYVPGRIFNIVV